MIPSVDTICALATPAGKGGISVIRVSGPKTLDLCLQLTGLTPAPRQCLFAKFCSPAGELIDAGLALYFKSPHSFTGEDVCEFHCHGSPVVVDQLLQTLAVQGARLARPGEFSERAFLNDKLDLTQAEAIADLIDSSSVAAARHAVRSLQGDFSKLITQLVSDVVALRVYVEASIDFADEEIDFLNAGNIAERLQAQLTLLEQILAQAKQGSLLREGLQVVIAGAPNAGKSTLLNSLSGEEVAIVTPVAGTTRDMLRHQITLDGIPIHLTDTAGLRDSDDPIEQEGIRRARAAITRADHVLLLVDAQQTLDYRSLPLWKELSALSAQQLTVVFNKIDLCEIEAHANTNSAPVELFLSAHKRTGLTLLKDHLKLCAGFNPAVDGGFIARRRHLIALTNAASGLYAALHCLQELKAGELVAEELRKVQQSLDEITGKFTTDDLLGAIFSSFCIGK
ncbi:MAG: tRNA uridine-5-carboxymethylaminomethyl(34) synthesis GTPase MnmE [Pseudomonadota bacterium]